jgi:hypothetical protein
MLTKNPNLYHPFRITNYVTYRQVAKKYNKHHNHDKCLQETTKKIHMGIWSS